MRTFAVVLVLLLCLSLGAVEKEPLQEYKTRRERVAAKANGEVVVLFGAPDKDLVKFQQEPNFYYLTGFDEPDAMLVIDASVKPEHDYLFLKPRDLVQEHWTGVKWGLGGDAEKATGIQSVLSTNTFPEMLKKLSSHKSIYTLNSEYRRLRAVLRDVQPADITPAIAELRQVKSAGEIALLDKAVQFTLKGHQAAAGLIAPGVIEYEVADAL